MLAPLATPTRRRLQRRTLVLLAFAQVLSGVGAGAVVSVGSLLAVQLSGSRAWAGSMTTAMTMGAALASAALARLVVLRGRRRALATGLSVAAGGAVGVVLATVTGALWLLVVSGLLLGFGSAANLQARFAATDLSAPAHRGRDLSLVVWMGTVGAVAGPSLVGIGGNVADVVGVPALSGLFALSAVGMLFAVAVIWIGLRPDPYLAAEGRESTTDGQSTRSTAVPVARDGQAAGVRQGMWALARYAAARVGLIAVLTAHAVMVAVMSVTAVHLTAHGASVTLVGVTVSLHIAGMYALAPVMGLLTDRLGGPAVVAGGLVTLATGGLLAGFSGAAHPLTAVGLVLLGLGWSAATVAGSAMIAAGVPSPDRVAAQGASDALMSLAGAIGGLLAGLALAVIGFLGLGIACATVVALALVALFRSREPSIGE
ncbi:MAG TPA: MFS transporter [Jiangellales bacterium]|nr:MFS transporter [Jiangellales bacterium]